MFFFVFFSLYGGFNLFAFLRLKRAFALDPLTMAALGGARILMVFAPALVRILERHRMTDIARSLAYTGYLWMALIFLFVSATLLIDGTRMLLWAVVKVFEHDHSFILLTSRQSFFLSLIISLGITAHGFLDALNMRSEHITIRTTKLPAGIERFTIVQISDVHLGLMAGKKRLARILKRVEASRPDILVSTGDLVDGRLSESVDLTEMIRRISTPHGKYAVTGNHEFYAGIEEALAFTTAAGFTVLHAESESVAGVLTVVGVDDPTGIYYGFSGNVSERGLLKELDNEQFILLLKHRPVAAEGIEGLFDLQLSGHTHKGQIFPFSLIVKRVYPKTAGLHVLGNNQHLYVSRGAGTWGPPVRFLSPPEVTVIELRGENGKR